MRCSIPGCAMPRDPAARRRPAGALRRLLADPNAALGLALVVLLILAALLAPALAPHDPTAISLAAAYRGPSGDHWLGTDEVGRDILSRVLYGTRLSLMTGFAAVGFALALGLPIGMLAGGPGGGPPADGDDGRAPRVPDPAPGDPHRDHPRLRRGARCWPSD
jgi:ABC-type dipeptide/oligopeptide/nickel transport system permease subunit